MKVAVFLDTGVFVAARNSRDRNHKRATELFGEALRGKFGVVYTSDYVIDEAITTALFRTRNFGVALNVGRPPSPLRGLRGSSRAPMSSSAPGSGSRSSAGNP